MREQEPLSKHPVKTVLVVEDDQDIGEVFVQALSLEPSYIAVLVADGEEALAVVQDIRPDLVVLDYHLRHMNGIELYDHMQTMKALQDIPAILVSATLPEGEMQQRGMVGLSKPLDLNDLLETTNSLLRSSERKAPHWGNTSARRNPESR
jgi:CheY-like chemotaxis protein